MNRVKELREEQGLSIEELAKLLGMSDKEYSKNESIDEVRLFTPDELEKIAIRLGVPKSYLGGRTNYLSAGERQFRKEIKEVAQNGLKTGYFNGMVPDQYRSSVNQLCTAANLIRVAESIEELSDKVSELNDTIYSYGMFVSSQP
ncbi:helix-turn-helix domain-containing protein [Lactobacillus apis]|uniref:helix-turn-helix domain-containing protein n=1 Tax=Lactobacillus apis TaxID=303541 RepID=UPI00164F1B48|nr:helix-turn-helix transcriptional regulator [Lactobacillus apis]